jgi:uncharacterized membrane protein YagU involved in acid resistance
MSAAASPQPRAGRALPAILLGGLLAGIGDITQAFVVFGYFSASATPFRILQSIPRGIFGARVFQMGWTSAVLGIVIHFTIATTAATVYYAASRRMRVLVDRPILFGLLYGEAVFLFMYFVVMPLSAIGFPRFNLATYITGPIGHTVLVGLPISLVTRRFSR